MSAVKEIEVQASVPSPARFPAAAPWLTRLDIAGAFGDIGVLFPIAIALITLNGLNPTAVFLAAGAAYILSAWYFGIPMSVQPLKAVAAIALATGLAPSAIASAGLWMAGLLAFIAVTNAATWLARLFTLPIVRGIQLGLGLLLIREGLRLMLSSPTVLSVSNGIGLPSWAISLAAFILLLLFRNSERFPAALVLLAAGLGFGLFRSRGSANLALGPLPLQLVHPHLNELREALVLLVLPQFALTFGNSIVATENTAAILYGPQARRVTIRGLSFSIALMNLVSGVLQASPMCHGSGGITAHYKFGARTPKSSYVIGALCLVLALSGRAAMTLLHLIPTAVLGVFLFYIGIQHAAFLRDIVKQLSLLLIAVAVGIVALLTTNLGWGFLTGFALQLVLSGYQRFQARRT